ncbi:MAG: Tfp pilus assembly protein PilO [Candidatus Omnitrophota bacterium]
MFLFWGKEMNLDTIMKTSWGKLGAMTLVIFIMGIWMANLFVLGDMKKDLNAVKLNLKLEKEKREPLENIVRSNKKIENTLDSFWQTNDVKKLIQVINDTATKYPINIESLTPQTNIVLDHFEAMGVQLMGTAKYHDLGKFVAALESHAPEIHVKTATLSSTGANPNNDSLSFNLALRAHTPLKEDRDDAHEY